jgi:repressor of nif and glnA expression
MFFASSVIFSFAGSIQNFLVRYHMASLDEQTLCTRNSNGKTGITTFCYRENTLNYITVK